MNVKPSRLRLAIILFLLAIGNTLIAQPKKRPDARYFSTIRGIDSMATTPVLRARARDAVVIDSATRRLHRLWQVYRLTVQDANQLVILALLCGNADALHAGLESMVAYTAREPAGLLRDAQEFVVEVYGIKTGGDALADTVLARFPTAFMTDTDLAKLNLDWEAILLIERLYTRDQTLRLTPDRFFRDSSMSPGARRQYLLNGDTAPGKMMAMETVDSGNIGMLAAYLKSHAFPGESYTGEHALKLWVILRHGCGLLATDDPVLRQGYVAQYRFMMPLFFKAATEGQFSRERYAYVHQTLMGIVAKNADPATVAFFAELALP